MLPSKLVAKTSEKAPVSATRKTNMVNQPRALEAIYPTCAIPDCEVMFDHCNVHHIKYWAISDSGGGGSTDLNNMVPLCSRHHHAAHEGGWKLQLDPENRELTIT